MTTIFLQSRFQQSFSPKDVREVLDQDLVEHLAHEVHVQVTSVPVSLDDYLYRRAKLWSLIQAIDPETANLEEIAAEKAALDVYQRAVSLARARQAVTGEAA